MGVTINADLSATITREDGSFCNLPNYNPETLLPWGKQSQLEEYIAKVQSNDRFFVKPSPKRKVLTPVEFKMQFTAQERVAIKAAAAAGDPLLEDFLEVLNDPRLKDVDLTLDANIQAIGYLISLALLTAERGQEILAGL